MSLPNFFSTFNKDISWIKTNTIYLARHGSIAYGTNTIDSDEDFKGVCLPPKKYYFSPSNHFEQAELNKPDVVIFDIKKFFKLAADCNPNSLEMLFVDVEDIIYIDRLGEQLIENREAFLSKKIKFTMMGYAISQLKRIKSHRRWLLHPVSAPPTRAELGLSEQTIIPKDQLMAVSAEIQKKLDRSNFDFMEDLDESIKIGVRSIMSEMLAELKITSDQQFITAARKVGLDDNFLHLMQKEREYSTKKREWDQYQNWKATRNPARAKLEAESGFDRKHAYHLIRLIRMCRETLTTGKVLVKRPDKEELLAIRNGAWTYEQVVEYAEREEKEINELYNVCNVLPKTPDKNKLDNLCIKLVEQSLSKYSRYNIGKKFDRMIEKIIG